MMAQDFPYEVMEEFGRGGCSIIYKVKHKQRQDDKQYVLKTMTVGDEDDQSSDRFYMEYEFLRAYPHPNLIEVKEYFKEWLGKPAYVMEWIEGDTWQNFWRERSALEDVQTFLSMFKQLCDGLDFIHDKKIVHRDLKPQNILISNKQELKIIDFGIMKVADLTMYTQRNTFMGSAYYVAPEGVADEPVTHTADVFSLGVILYDLFTGMKPFKGHTLGETIYQRLVKKPQPPSQIAEIPPELDPIILKMLERDPRQRQQSCGEIYRELEGLFGKYQPEPVSDDTTEVDILTKEPLLHHHFLQASETFIKEKKVLFLLGEQGSGKTTIVENLGSRLAPEATIRLDCQTNSTDMEFMEAILRNLNVSKSGVQRLEPWRLILSSALPGLQWNGSGPTEGMTLDTIMSAFLKYVNAVREPTAVIIEDLQHASTALLQFLTRLGQTIATRANPRLMLILTTTEPMPSFNSFGMPISVSFPDVIALAEYLEAQFGDCQIPIDLTQALVRQSGKNIADYTILVKHLKETGGLWVDEGVLKLKDFDHEEKEETGPMPVPMGLTDFSTDEIRQLEWIALCPDGIDLNLLRALTHAEVGALGATLTKATSLGILESQSTVTDGFRWKNEDLQNILIKSLSNAQKTERYTTLAQTIENESEVFLAHSPPLWLMLCRLYQLAEDDDRASDYGVRYASYCFQNANYEPIRTHLSQFIDHSKFEEDQSFWCMLALAYHEEDIVQALFYGAKALEIKENVESLALMSILEYHGQNEKQAYDHSQRLFEQDNVQGLDIHYITLLMPILIALNEVHGARILLNVLEKKLKGSNDLFATNTLVLTKMMMLRTYPARLIESIRSIEQELLPQTYRKLNLWAGVAYQDLFQYDKALASIKVSDHGVKDLRQFEDLLFLYVNFGKINEVKNLISIFNDAHQKNLNLQEIAPVFQLITEMLMGDPKIYEFQHVSNALTVSKVERSCWLALILSRLDPGLVKPEYIKRTLELLDVAAVPWARGQVPRFRILAEVKFGRNVNLTVILQKAIDTAHEYGLIMEKLRLFVLQDELKRFGHTVARLNFHFEPGFMETPSVFQFTKLNTR